MLIANVAPYRHLMNLVKVVIANVAHVVIWRILLKLLLPMLLMSSSDESCYCQYCPCQHLKDLFQHTVSLIYIAMFRLGLDTQCDGGGGGRGDAGGPAIFLGYESVAHPPVCCLAFQFSRQLIMDVYSSVVDFAVVLKLFYMTQCAAEGCCWWLLLLKVDCYWDVQELFYSSLSVCRWFCFC